MVRRGAKLLHAFAEAVVPRVTLVTRKAYGGAYIAMNSRSLGATAVFAWPDAEVAVMGAKAAVGILHRKKLAAAPPGEREALHAQLAEEHERIAGGVNRALEIGVVDEVIEPGADPAPARRGAGRRAGRPRRARQHPAVVARSRCGRAAQPGLHDLVQQGDRRAVCRRRGRARARRPSRAEQLGQPVLEVLDGAGPLEQPAQPLLADHDVAVGRRPCCGGTPGRARRQAARRRCRRCGPR